MAATPSFDRNRLIATLSDWAKQRLTPAKSGLAQSLAHFTGSLRDLERAST